MECTLCKYKTEWIFVYKNHLIEHKMMNLFDCTENLKKYICQECNTNFKRKVEYHYHLKKCKEHKSNIVDGEINLETFRAKLNTLLKSHNLHRNTPNPPIIKVKLLQCEECDYKTRRPNSLKSHIRKKHIILNESDISLLSEHDYSKKISAKQKQYNCAHCYYFSYLKQNLRSHILYQHTPDERIKWFQCQQCKFKTKFPQSLKEHVKAHHSNLNEYVTFQCEDCDYSGITKSQLRRHMLIKHSTDDRKCKHCDYTTKFPNAMKKHILNKHTPDDKIEWWQCTECDYKSKVLSGLRKHVARRHCITRTYQCVECGHFSVTKGDLKIHMLHKHTPYDRIIWWKCQECEFKTKTSQLLKSHVIRMHTNVKKTKVVNTKN